MNLPRSKAKTWFLTYPRCPVPLNDLLAHFQTLGTLLSYIICSETHEDGGLHRHAYLDYDSTIRFTPTFFDYKEYHGNYQVAKNKKAI